MMYVFIYLKEITLSLLGKELTDRTYLNWLAVKSIASRRGKLLISDIILSAQG